VAAVNKGTSRSPDLLVIIKKLFWLNIEHGFKLTAAYLPGRLNIISDRISWLHESESAVEAHAMLSNDDVLESNGHMTDKTFLFLQECWGTD
jgi:hypothetical protein